MDLYTSMIGTDDWCIHFDKENRQCKVYEDRPQFCKVDKKSYKKMFDVEPEDFTVSYSLFKLQNLFNFSLLSLYSCLVCILLISII